MTKLSFALKESFKFSFILTDLWIKKQRIGKYKIKQNIKNVKRNKNKV